MNRFVALPDLCFNLRWVAVDTQCGRRGVGRTQELTEKAAAAEDCSFAVF